MTDSARRRDLVVVGASAGGVEPPALQVPLHDRVGRSQLRELVVRPLLADFGDVRGAVLTLSDTPREVEQNEDEHAAGGRSA